MSLCKTEGIVLHHFNLGEADRIITFYTRNMGKVKAVAKGVRRPRSQAAGPTQLFTYANLLIFKGNNLDKLSQINIIESFSKLREDLLRMAYGTYILELIKELTVEDDPNEAMFNLLLKTLYLLCETSDPEMITRMFELRAMSLTGFKPMLTLCLKCQDQISGNQVNFHPSSGGIVCQKCAPDFGGKMITISKGTLEVMKNFLESNFQKLTRIKLTPYSRKELELALEQFIEYHVGSRLKSLAFLKSVKKMD